MLLYRRSRLRHSERGAQNVSFAMIFPFLIMLIFIIFDLVKVGSSKALLTRVCSRGASQGAATWPVVDVGSGGVDPANIYCGNPQTTPAGFYQAYRTDNCGGKPDCSFSPIEVLAIASAAQQFCSDEDNSPERNFTLPEKLDDCVHECAYILPTSYPNTEESGELELECGMAIKLFSTPFIEFIKSVGRSRQANSPPGPMPADDGAEPRKHWHIKIKVARTIAR